jgi:capsular polysaccharide biosynthesis protein
MYTSSVKLYVISRQSDQTTTLSDIQSSTQLVKDYKVLVTSLPVVDQVITDLGLNIDDNDLINKIECTIETDSRVLAITVTDADPVQAKHIADDLADVFSSRITQIMKIDSVNVIEYGSVAESPASPNVKKNVAIGLLIGILLSTSIIVIKFIVDDTIKTSEDVERYLGISTLSLIPLTREEYNGKKSKRKRRLRR